MACGPLNDQVMKRECLQWNDGTVLAPINGSGRDASYVRRPARQHAPQGTREQPRPGSNLVSSAIILAFCAMSAIAACACSVLAPQGREIGRAHTSRRSASRLRNACTRACPAHMPVQLLSFALQMDRACIYPALYVFLIEEHICEFSTDVFRASDDR